MLYFQRNSNFALGKKPLVTALLSVLFVLAMITQFALPVFADQVVEEPAPSFLPGGYSGSISGMGVWTTFYNYGVPANTTACYLELEQDDCAAGSTTFTIRVLVNGGVVWNSPTLADNGSGANWYTAFGGAISAGAGSTISLQACPNSSSCYVALCAAADPYDPPLMATGSTTSAYVPTTNLMVEYDAANQTTAQTAATQATNAAASASTAATDAAAAQTAANSANTEATTAASNTTNDPTADSAITNSTTGMAATNNTVGIINTNVNTINTDTAQYDSETAAYWANQAATAATSNIVPAISSVDGQNGATCTTGTTFTANVDVSPSSSITYAVTGVPGYSASGNSITFIGLSSGAYTAIINATYTPTGKTCTYAFTFFKI